MTSPLVTRLTANISSCADPVQRAIWTAELSCYLARTGEFDQADKLRVDLRRDFGDGRSASVSILIMCIESLLLYFKGLSPNARDRMLRANLLSKTFQLDRLIALTSAWLAHIDFNQNRFESMGVELLTCAKFVHADDGTAACRASLVLGDAFLFAGDVRASKAWYEKARWAATSIGDHAAIGAMIYNRAALRVSTARFANLLQTVSLEDISVMNTEVHSAINYQAAARLTSLDHLLGSAKAGVLMLRAAYAEARIEINKLLSSPDIESVPSQAKLLQADLMFIIASSEGSPAVGAWLEQVLDLVKDMAADDRALVLSTAGTTAGIVGDRQAAEKLHALGREAIEDHGAVMQSLRQRIAAFELGLFPNEMSS